MGKILFTEKKRPESWSPSLCKRIHPQTSRLLQSCWHKQWGSSLCPENSLTLVMVWCYFWGHRYYLLSLWNTSAGSQYDYHYSGIITLLCVHGYTTGVNVWQKSGSLELVEQKSPAIRSSFISMEQCCRAKPDCLRAHSLSQRFKGQLVEKNMQNSYNDGIINDM